MGSATGTHKQTFTKQGRYYTDRISFNADGVTLANMRNNSILLWNSTTEEEKTFTGHTDLVKSIAFSPDGQTLASGSRDKTIHLWDVATGTHKKTLTGHKDSINSLSFSADGRTLASGSRDKTVRLWNVTTGVHKKTLRGHADDVKNVAFSPDGQTVASWSDDHTLRLWDLATGATQPNHHRTYHFVISIMSRSV